MPGADDLSLSQSYFSLTTDTPAGTLFQSPLTTQVAIPPALLTEVWVLIPRGHAGQTGIRVVYSGAVILPFGSPDNQSWLVGDDLAQAFPVSFPISNKLTVQTYNQGKFDHLHYVRFKVDYNAISDAGARRSLAIVPVA